MTKESIMLEDLRSHHREKQPDRFNLFWLRGRHEITEAEAKRILTRFKESGEGE